MKPFNVLDRHQSILNNCLLEASAGTGKTFSIENIVVRLLLENKEGEVPFELEELLVVTFTRAAARELRRRIRTTIEKGLNHLKNPFDRAEIPDYILRYIEEGEESRLKASKRLENALFTFDRSQIFTLHSFCAKMLLQFPLEGDMGFKAVAEESALPQEKLKALIDDYFRTELRVEEISPAQLFILLEGDPEQKKLLKAIQNGNQWLPIRSFQEQYHSFCTKWEELGRYDPLLLIEDFEKQAPFYRNHKSGETKADTLEKIKRFALTFHASEATVETFDCWIREGLVWLQALAPSNKKPKAPSSEELHYPLFQNKLETLFASLIQEASDFSFILARTAASCRALLERFNSEEEHFSPDDLLRKMEVSIKNPTFYKSVQDLYKAAIIDEFQDTDPLQWKLFDSLFLSSKASWKGFIYLVGDPKQSIYSFRQADIYTYIKASQAFHESERFSLDTNYRSKPPLIEALNTLFSQEKTPEWIVLPRKSTSLPYRAVKSPKEAKEEDAFLHFFVADLADQPKISLQKAEEEVYFPFIAENLLRLNRDKEISFSDFAILVRDRYQAVRLGAYLEKASIPSVNQRGSYLADSPILQGFIDFMRALSSPHDRSALNAALGSVLIGWTFEDFQAHLPREPLLAKLRELRFVMQEKGFVSFFENFLKTSFCLEGESLAMRLLKREEGLALYRDLLQIGDYLMTHENRDWRGLEESVRFLDTLYAFEKEEANHGLRLQDPNTNSVKLLTLHYSKGLEFEVVFALGLINRSHIHDDWFPTEKKEGSFQLTPPAFCPLAYQKYLEENDAEKMRQLYVALTRAKRYLFIPVACGLESQNLKKGEASPIELFLAHLGKQKYDYESLYTLLREGDPTLELFAFLEANKEKKGIHFSKHRKIEPPLRVEREEEILLKEPNKVKIHAPPLLVASFSSLNRHQSQEDENRESAPSCYNPEEKNSHTLPANSETGLLLHKILEEIDFSLPTEKLASFVAPYLEGTPYAGWNATIVTLLENLLQVTLKSKEESFTLSELDPFKIYREMPFLYRCEKEEIIPEIAFHEGMIKGVIDLIFLHKGRYHLLDWKSNWLGTSCEAYTFSKMEAAMIANGYFLQAKIYKEALKRYLKLVDGRPFEECFGGVFYLFLRGITLESERGLYFFK